MLELMSSVEWKYSLTFSVRKLLHSELSEKIVNLATSFYECFLKKMLNVSSNEFFPSLFGTSANQSVK